MELYDYVSGSRPLSGLLELLDPNDNSDFFRAEQSVLDTLPRSRHSAERIMEYLREADSFAARNALTGDFRRFLTDAELAVLRNDVER